MDIKFLNNLSRTEPYQPLNGDISFDYNQDLVTISDLDYINQQYAKLFISGQGNDPYFNNFGTTVPFLIFNDITSSVVQNELTNTILGAISYQLEIETSTLATERVSGVSDIQIAEVSDIQIAEARTNSELGATITITLTVASGEQTVVLIGG